MEVDTIQQNALEALAKFKQAKNELHNANMRYAEAREEARRALADAGLRVWDLVVPEDLNAER